MKKKIFLMGVLGLLLPLKTYAFNGGVSLSCNKTNLNPGESTTCIIRGNTVDAVLAVSSMINLGDNLSLENVSVDSIWQGDGEDGNIQLYTDVDKSGDFGIATFNIKAGNTAGVNTSVSLTTSLFDSSYVGNPVTVDPVNIRIVSNNNTLSGITIDDRAIADFSSNKYSYNISVDSNVNSIKIGATATDSASTVSGDIGNKNVSYGNNVYTIVVTGEGGSRSEYVVNVVRTEIRELKELSINGKKIDLQKGKYEYDLVVENSVSSAKIVAVLENDDVSFVDSFGNRNEKLEVGNNIILIKTKDKNNDELTYKITVNRLDEEGKSIVPNEETKNPENPKTGVKVSIAICCTVLVLGIVSYVVIRKKNYFNNI